MAVLPVVSAARPLNVDAIPGAFTQWLNRSKDDLQIPSAASVQLLATYDLPTGLNPVLLFGRSGIRKKSQLSACEQLHGLWLPLQMQRF